MSGNISQKGAPWRTSAAFPQIGINDTLREKEASDRVNRPDEWKRFERGGKRPNRGAEREVRKKETARSHRPSRSSKEDYTLETTENDARERKKGTSEPPQESKGRKEEQSRGGGSGGDSGVKSKGSEPNRAEPQKARSEPSPSRESSSKTKSKDSDSETHALLKMVSKMDELGKKSEKKGSGEVNNAWVNFPKDLTRHAKEINPKKFPKEKDEYAAKRLEQISRTGSLVPPKRVETKGDTERKEGSKEYENKRDVEPHATTDTGPKDKPEEYGEKSDGEPQGSTDTGEVTPSPHPENLSQVDTSIPKIPLESSEYTEMSNLGDAFAGTLQPSDASWGYGVSDSLMEQSFSEGESASYGCSDSFNNQKKPSWNSDVVDPFQSEVAPIKEWGDTSAFETIANPPMDMEPVVGDSEISKKIEIPQKQGNAFFFI